MAYVFLLLTVILFWAMVIGLIKPTIVLRWGLIRSRKRMASIYGFALIASFVLFMVFAGLSMPANSTATSVDKTSKIQSKNYQDVKKEKVVSRPLTWAQMNTMLAWSQNEYESLISRFDGLSPGSYELVDPGWDRYQHVQLQVITAKETTFPKTNNTLAGGHQVQWIIQSDVNSVMEQVWQTCSSMGVYLSGGSYSDVYQNESMYRQILNKALKEVQDHQLVDS